MKKKLIKKHNKQLLKKLNRMQDLQYYINIVNEILKSNHSSTYISEKSGISLSTISYMRNELVDVSNIKLSTALALVKFYENYYDENKGE